MGVGAPLRVSLRPRSATLRALAATGGAAGPTGLVPVGPAGVVGGALELTDVCAGQIEGEHGVPLLS